jgi:hypothetical protein
VPWPGALSKDNHAFKASRRPAIGLEERCAQLIEHLPRHTNAVIAHCGNDRIWFGSHRHLNAATGTRELDGVRQQIIQDAAQPRGIDIRHLTRRLGGKRQRNLLLGRLRLCRVGQLAQQARYIDVLCLSGSLIKTRQLNQILQRAQQALAARGDLTQCAQLIWPAIRKQQVGKSQYRTQGRTQLMTQVGQQVRLGALGCLRPPPLFDQAVAYVALIAHQDRVTPIASSDSTRLISDAVVSAFG